MKIEAYDPCKKCEEVTRLRLVERYGVTYLCAVNADGTTKPYGNLAYIDERGIHLCSGVGSDVKIARGSKHSSEIAVHDDYTYGALN